MWGAVLLAFGLQASFSHGLPIDPGYFPIAVWLQSPAQAARYKAAGFNLYVGLWDGPTEQQLSDLRAAGMPVICDQNSVGLTHRDDPTIVGWMHGDEPDNAQQTKDGYGPCIPPVKVVDEYQKIRAADPTRPVMLNLGQGVANDEWLGRGSGANLKDYETYVKGADLVSFDVYPVAGLPKPDPENYLWYVSKGVDRLRGWVAQDGVPGERVWNCIECTRIGGDRKATPSQVESEVWMAIIHGSQGLIYFVHQFKPAFDEHALLDDPEMLSAVTELNKRIRSLALVLNSPSLSGQVSVRSSNDAAPIDLMVKRSGGKLYLFAVNMRNSLTTGHFQLPDTLYGGTAMFEDRFSPYQWHIYRFDEAVK